MKRNELVIEWKYYEAGIRTYRWSVVIVLLLIACVTPFWSVQANRSAQEIATATPTASIVGVIATVKTGEQDFINVRGGPGVDYALLGRLMAGEQVAAIGRSPGGDWVQILYPSAPGGVAWIYAWLVTLSGEVPIVEPPPLPTPLTTPTVNPTLAAQFIIDLPPTRLPTFTPPSAIKTPAFASNPSKPASPNPPTLYFILGLALIGILGLIISFVRIR